MRARLLCEQRNSPLFFFWWHSFYLIHVRVRVCVSGSIFVVRHFARALLPVLDACRSSRKHNTHHSRTHTIAIRYADESDIISLNSKYCARTPTHTVGWSIPRYPGLLTDTVNVCRIAELTGCYLQLSSRTLYIKVVRMCFNCRLQHRP